MLQFVVFVTFVQSSLNFFFFLTQGGFFYRVWSHDVKATMLAFENNPVGIELWLNTNSFASVQVKRVRTIYTPFNLKNFLIQGVFKRCTSALKSYESQMDYFTCFELQKPFSPWCVSFQLVKENPVRIGDTKSSGIKFITSKEMDNVTL